MSLSRMWLTLAGMTVASSMILIDQTAVPLATPDVVDALDAPLSLAPWILTANILPLAALMVLGGRLGDLLGLRRVFLTGAVVFTVATVFAGLAQSMPWMIAARATQGAGAALMMPTAVAIVSAVFPEERRGMALGILAGASAFFAALGPVVGGALTSVDWRLVFLVNVPLAVIAIVLTLTATPKLSGSGGSLRGIDWAGAGTFGLAVAALVFALNQGQGGWGGADVIVPFAISAVALIVFVIVERRVAKPLIEFRLLRHANFLAANISQTLAGMIELGLGFLLPFYLLLVVGVGPVAAGIALLPATIPIILAGPLAGRAFDAIGGRLPLGIGFLVLAASGLVLAVEASGQTAGAIIPGLILQGIGLGIVLTVNDPVGLTAVPERDRGLAAGMLNTAEQMGGALGIAILGAIELTAVRNGTLDRLRDQGIEPSGEQIEEFRDFILKAEQEGVTEAMNEAGSRGVQQALTDSSLAHVDAFEITFVVSAGIALLGALCCLALIRRGDRLVGGPAFGRRSRWVYASAGRTPGLTRHPGAGSGDDAADDP